MKSFELMTAKEWSQLDRDNERARRTDWRQTVTTQHTVIATLAGLQVTALTLFTALNKGSHSFWQKLFFIVSMILLVIIVACLIFIAEHERKDAFDSSKITDENRNRENFLRSVLNKVTLLNAVAIAALLIISYLES